MTPPRAAASGWAVAVLACVLAGCTGPDSSPVPDVAEPPFVCDGVPQEGAELILGGPVEAERSRGSWQADDRFSCAVAPVDGDGGTIMISSMPPDGAGNWGVEPEGILGTLSAQGGAEPIGAEADGGGYTYAESSAGWVCADRFTLVVLDDVTTAGRDGAADAGALLVSMLPWACGGTEAPPASG